MPKQSINHETPSHETHRDPHPLPELAPTMKADEYVAACQAAMASLAAESKRLSLEYHVSRDPDTAERFAATAAAYKEIEQCLSWFPSPPSEESETSLSL